MSTSKTKIVYVTTNHFKHDNRVFLAHCRLADGTLVGDAFEFEIRDVRIAEMLEVDITKMVWAEARRAYERIGVPCVVEHAGLVFEEYKTQWYPGGLTKPMWDTLGDKFLQETNSAGRRVIARAVVGYCDGMRTHTFSGETPGVLADRPRGSRNFYWDTVFVPDDPTGRTTGKTYAEVIDNPALGLSYKIEHLSQSSRAMLEFLNFRRRSGGPELWRWS